MILIASTEKLWTLKLLCRPKTQLPMLSVEPSWWTKSFVEEPILSSPLTLKSLFVAMLRRSRLDFHKLTKWQAEEIVLKASNMHMLSCSKIQNFLMQHLNQCWKLMILRMSLMLRLFLKTCTRNLTQRKTRNSKMRSGWLLPAQIIGWPDKPKATWIPELNSGSPQGIETIQTKEQQLKSLYKLNYIC